MFSALASCKSCSTSKGVNVSDAPVNIFAHQVSNLKELSAHAGGLPEVTELKSSADVPENERE